MLAFNKFKLFCLAVVLGALLAMSGGLVVSLAAGGQPTVKALSYDDRVRFMVEGDDVSLLRAEVFDLAGKRLFDSGPVMAIAVSNQRSAVRFWLIADS